MRSCLMPKIKYDKATLIAFFVIAIGVICRVIGFGKIPYGLNQDEAFAAYEAFSLINYGVDSAGNPFPTYFVSWGSGMNVLESYLSIPFMLIFGYSEAAFRMPSLLCAIISLPVFWLLLKRLFNNHIAIIGLSLLSISPWHVMLSRWGLESNLAPSFLLFGLYFFIKSIDKNAYLLLSALFFGLSLYAYSVLWLTLPLLLIAFGFYIIKIKPAFKIGYVIGGCLILFTFALPHIPFLLINANVIPEIKTSFFTIPKLVYIRSEEISLLNIFKLEGWTNLLKILFSQYDTIKSNALSPFGLFYHVSTPFLIIGFVALIFKLKSDIKLKKFSGAYFALAGFIICFITCLCFLNININKANSLHIFTLITITFGVYTVINFVKNKTVAITAISLAFAVCFTAFNVYYFSVAGTELSDYYSKDLKIAVETVNERDCQNVAVDRSIYHSQILFYDKTNQKVFENTVKYEEYPHPYLKATSFGKYTFIYEYNNLKDYDAYVFPVDHLYFFSAEDYDVTVFEKYAVAFAK